MIIAFIITLAVVALLVDWYIYKTTVKACNRKWVRRVYIVHVVLIDLLTALALLFYHKMAGIETQGYMRAIMWIVYLFMLFIVPKVVYALFLSLDLLLGWLLKGRLYLFRWLGLAGALAVFGVMVWGATGGRNRIRVTEITVSSARIPASFDGYRIVLFADLHAGNLPANHRLLERLSARINELRPDLVVNGGDLVNRDARELDSEIMGILRGIDARDGVYGVFGNHDLGYYLEPDCEITPAQNVQLLRDKQRAMGWRLMENETDFIRRGNDSISVSGVNFPLTGRHNGVENGLGGTDFPATYRGVSDSTFNILIAHTPESWDEALAFGYGDLTLSGHVHAMQAKITLGNWRWSPAEYMYERWSGLYTKGEKNLYVNDGVGYVMYPMRIGANPELTLIILKHE